MDWFTYILVKKAFVVDCWGRHEWDSARAIFRLCKEIARLSLFGVERGDSVIHFSVSHKNKTITDHRYLSRLNDLQDVNDLTIVSSFPFHFKSI